MLNNKIIYLIGILAVGRYIVQLAAFAKAVN